MHHHVPVPTAESGALPAPAPATGPQDARPPDGGGRTARPFPRRAPDAGLLTLLLAAALWLYALPRIGFREMGDYGLLDRLPAAYYLSLLVLTAGFVLTLRRAGTAPWWPALHCAALLFALKAPPAILYDAVRYPWASKHDAVVNTLLANGELRPNAALSGNMSAYDQWPGFFTLDAGLVRAFGVESAAAYANWAPIVLGLLMMPVLMLLYRTFSQDWRLVWTAVWIFQLANWVGQDYFAPQGLAFLLHLTVITVVLRHFVRPGSAGRLRDRARLDPAAAGVPPPTGTRQRAVCVAILAPLLLAVNATHQLTPVMLCVCLSALCLTRRYRNVGLLTVTVLLMLAWDLTMGRPLFTETLSTLKESIGELTQNSRAGYAGELTGPGPELAGTANVLMVLAVAALAGAALVLRRRLVRSALPLLLVSAAPVPLFAVNDYGGEMLFRVYLFGLPGAAFFAAAALVPGAAGTSRDGARALRRRVSAVALPAVLLVLLAGFMPSYYGKETMYYTPPEETALVTRALDNAPDGSLILATTGSFPQALHRYDRIEHWFFAEQELPENERMLQDPAGYLAAGIPPGTRAYVVLTRTQDIYTAGEGLLPPGGFATLRAELAGSPLFRTVESHDYGVVLEYRPADRGTTTTTR
ncbi:MULTISPECIES: hypothetical protein [unclassified Streptomyces]|uniref:hypothetical protein n=1 Tax=unclassified Streptomyces TaxID=2593676 RepID=UPI000AEA37D0|nr:MULTISPECIES: hypothetical protein [unclassified Streptomyces]AZM60646.1 hypothetical protein DLM49_14705 [Streptomyces sp. WAC 01438]RSM94279.1 hypothetical protein DMA10_19090 [Streptomyces sp. WAC 01420]